MARVYKPTFTIPIPADAELFERDGERFARLRRNGRMVTAPVTKRGPHAGQRVTVEARCYAIEYTDAAGHVRRAKGFRDKAATEARATELERGIERQQAGILTQRELDTSKALAAGVAEHVKAYLEHLQAAGVSEWHLSESRRRLENIITACGFTKLADVAAEPVQRWLNLRTTEGMGASTRNTYLRSLRALVRWAIADGRMTTDPLVTVKLADESADVRRERRALTETELATLLRVAEVRPLAEYGRESAKRPDDAKGRRGPLAYSALTLANIDAAAARAAENLRMKPAHVAKLRRLGRERGLIYRTLVLTGFRRGELAALTWGDVEIDDPRPTVTVRACVAKNSKAATLPLRADLAASLRDWRAECGGPEKSARVFTVPKQLVLILNRDLDAAGIAKRDATGRTVDVHALRKTTGTWLARGGVAPQTAQRIMRHGDYRTTLKRYTDPRLLDTAAALSALPSFGGGTEAAPLRAAVGAELTPGDRPAAPGGLLGGTSRKTAQNGASGFNPDDGDDDRPNGGKPKRKQELATGNKGIQESGRPGSNRQHSAWKADALPIELRPQTNVNCCCAITYDFSRVWLK